MKSKKWIALLLAVLMVLAVSACGKSESAAPGGPAVSGSDAAEKDEAPAEENETAAEAVESDGYAKFCQLELGMTEDEVTAILGEPSRVDKAYHYYPVTVNGEEMELEVWINTVSGVVIYISGDFGSNAYRAEFADSATDFSAVDGLDSGELDTYEACAAAFKTPGYLISIDEDGRTRYLWVDSNDGYLTVSFHADGTVRSYSGFC